MKSISSRLLAVVLSASIIGMALIAIVAIVTASVNINVESSEKLEAMTKNEAASVGGWIESQKTYIDAYASTLSEMASFDRDEITAIGNKHMESQVQFFDVYVGYPSGQVMFASGFEPDYAGGWATYKRPWYVAALASPGEAVMTTPYIDSQTGKLCVTVSKAVTKNGEVVAVAAADIFTTTLEDIVLKGHSIKDSYAFLVDEGGDILIHGTPEYSMDAKTGVYKNLAQINNGTFAPLWKATSSGGSYTIKDAQGVEKRYTAHMIDSTGWMLYFVVPTSVINESQTQMLLLIIPLTIIIIPIVVALLFVYIRKLISRPIKSITAAAEKLADGDMNVTVSTRGFVGEMVSLADAFNRMVASVGAQVELTARIADGDLSANAVVRSDKDAMGIALNRMLDGLNEMFDEIGGATSHVAAGARQIATGAQTLAQGSTQQASAVEQLSASIEKVAAQTNDNANMAGSAAELADRIKGDAENGSVQMSQMTQAVKEINDASHSISKVIKVIDDIAFQTNILALNAAVEAARAGQHGKGFAVVAEEVRSLAAKSAEAAKETGSMIENSMHKAQLGAKIAEETAASLGKIVEGINQSSRIVGDIARSSTEQSSAIREINSGIDQVAMVVQQNSATAEESAATSQEMSRQSETLEHLITRFKLRGGDMSAHLPEGYSRGAEPGKRLVPPSQKQGVDNGYGKY